MSLWCSHVSGGYFLVDPLLVQRLKFFKLFLKSLGCLGFHTSPDHVHSAHAREGGYFGVKRIVMTVGNPRKLRKKIPSH